MNAGGYPKNKSYFKGTMNNEQQIDRFGSIGQVHDFIL